jgi:hypothetical protein
MGMHKSLVVVDSLANMDLISHYACIVRTLSEGKRVGWCLRRFDSSWPDKTA